VPVFFILRIFSCPHCGSSLAVANNPSQTTLSEEIPQQIMLLPDGAGAGRKTGDATACRGCITAQKTSRVVCSAQENTSFSNLRPGGNL